VGAVARKLGLRFICLDLSAEYLARYAAPRAEQKTTAAGLDEARLRRPRIGKEAARQQAAGQLGFDDELVTNV